jgi:hypothetical protein
MSFLAIASPVQFKLNPLLKKKAISPTHSHAQPFFVTDRNFVAAPWMVGHCDLYGYERYFSCYSCQTKRNE